MDNATLLRRRAKIVCTHGPASNSEEMIRAAHAAGMDVARLNFSHGTHDDHFAGHPRLRRGAAELKRTVCILQDLQGPKIRTGRGQTPFCGLQKGRRRVTITEDEVEGRPEIGATIQSLAKDERPGAPHSALRRPPRVGGD